MSALRFLTIDEVIALHGIMILDMGGIATLRDLALLESAIAQPGATYGGEFLHENIFLMAAAYFFHISQNQPFTDGNKRTGLACMFTFLKINGYQLDTTNEVLYPMLDRVAKGQETKEGLGSFINQHCLQLL